MFVNTGQEFDGSDSGARPDEAVSWGKIRTDAQPVKVLKINLSLYYLSIYLSVDLSIYPSIYAALPALATRWHRLLGGGACKVKRSFVVLVQVYADATLVFPLLVAETFALQADKLSPSKKSE